MKRLLLLSAMSAALLTPQSISAREILLVRPKMPNKVVCEGSSDFVPKGGRYVLDYDQGFVLALTPASVDIPICRSEDGGNQTLFRVRIGKVRSKFRHLTDPDSFLKIAGGNWQASLPADKETLISSIGTEFTTEAIAGGGLRVGMYEGFVLARSGGADAKVIVGQAATLEPGKAPEVFRIDYVLAIYDLRVSQELGKNVVTGRLAKGNAIAVDNGEVTTDGDRFRVVTSQQFLKVTNPAGTERYFFFGGRRPFFE